MNLTQMYHAGEAVLGAKHKEDETKKLGSLRAGNSSCLTADGQVIGGCHRLAYMRQQGVELPIPDHTYLMFQAGLANETIWVEQLKAALPDKLVLQEEDVPIAWATQNGTKVSGRPDIVIADASRKPEVGIELKQISSVWTFRDVIIEGKPKLAHLAQALHYMWQLNCTYKLAYTSRTLFAVAGGKGSWMAKLFPKKGELGSEVCDFNDKGDIKAVHPAMRVFDLRLNSRGILEFCDEGTDRWQASPVTLEGLKAFYEAVSNMHADDDLGPRPSTLDCHGEKASYTLCQYCELLSLCDAHEKEGAHAWLELVKNSLDKSNAPW